MEFNGRWFCQILDRDSGKLYSIFSLFPCSDILSTPPVPPGSPKGGGGGGLSKNKTRVFFV